MALRIAARSTTGGHAGENLAAAHGRLERHLDRLTPHRLPARQAAHVVLGHRVAVAVSQHGIPAARESKYGSPAIRVNPASSSRVKR